MGSWLQRASMPTPRHDLQTVAVDGKIYAISGAGYLTVDAVEIYEVGTDTWTQGPPIPTKRGWSGADLLGNKIYVAGGKTIRTPEEKQSSGDDTHFEIRDVLEVLDLESQTWSALEPLSEPRAGVSVTACDGKIYALGGNNFIHQLNAVEMYDPESGHWELGPALPFSVQMPGTATVNGKIYSIGGHSQEIEGGSFRAEMFVLDPAAGKWEELEPMPSARESMGIAVLDGKIYAMGGKGIDYSAATEVYDIEAGTWSSNTPLPAKCAWLDAAVVDGRIFAMGGAYKLSEEKPVYKWFDEVYEFVL